MHRRLKSFELRLARLTRIVCAWSEPAEREREVRERRVALASMLRAGLECAGLDPGEAPALRQLETPEPPPRPFVHPLRRLAERQRSLIEVLDAATRRYHQGPAPNLRQASAMQLIGYYCFGPGNQAHAAGEAPA